MTQLINPMDTYPYPVPAAQCPLLVAVLPLRYAIGPDRGFEASTLNLPPLDGPFPTLDTLHKIAPSAELSYTRRLLRDGWLYLWMAEQRRLIEYRISGFLLTQTRRGGAVVDTRQLPYITLPAGTLANLAWSPEQWNDEQFQAVKTKPAVRQRVMRDFIPGAGLNSGLTGGSAPKETLQVGDYMSPDSYSWSCVPDTNKRPDWIKTHFAMGHCEQQAWVAVDDPWGVILDLAALLRTRKKSFDEFRRQRGEDWAMANVLHSMQISDQQLAGKMREITDYPRLEQTRQEQDREEQRYDEDIRRLSRIWAAWLDTLRGRGVATLDTACGNFDITNPASRDALEQHFALACLGPADTPAGIKAISVALAPGAPPARPWLLWSLLGLAQRLGPGELKQLLDSAEQLKGNLPGAAEASAQLSRALTLSAALNTAADRLARHTPARAQEPLFAAIAPVAASQARKLPDSADDLLRYYMVATLARSGQRLETQAATRRQVGEWLSEQMGTKLDLPPAARLKPVAASVQDALPMLRLVPANDPASHAPKPGYGSQPPSSRPTIPPASVPHGGATPRTGRLLNLSKDALAKAPLKSLITLVAAANVGVALNEMRKSWSDKSLLSVVGGSFGAVTAGSAVIQRLAELKWETIASENGRASAPAGDSLKKALGRGMTTQILQSITSSFDIVIFGYEAVEAYRVGDFDTAAINGGLATASTAQLALTIKLYRAYRAGRLAVMMGQLAALRAGTALAGGWVGAVTLGLTLTVLGGLIARSYTQNTPLEQWVARTRFGVNRAAWAGNYVSEMTELYKVVFPITLELERYPELNPRTSDHIQVTWLILRLPAQTRLEDWMIHFTGAEVWDNHGWLGLRDSTRLVEWTGEDFDADIGSRRPQELGVARYRRVYHEDKLLGQLKKFRGKLVYTPLEGVHLPPLVLE